MKRLFVFIILVLIFQFIIVYFTTRQKNIIVPKAEGTAFFGFNIHSLPLLDGPQVKQLLTMVSQCNSTNVVRFWGFSGGGSKDKPNINNAVLYIGKVLQNSPADMQFVITLSNYYTAGVFQPWPAPEANPTQWFNQDWKTNGFKDFVNSVTTTYKGNSKILMWEIMNEPNCTGDAGCTLAQHKFLKEVADMIANNDPGKLISAGNQAQNTGGEHFDNGDYEDIVSYKNITAASCHTYINDANSTKENCVQALNITKKYNKFFYVGEIGVKDSGCTTPECVNACSKDKLQQRKNSILNIAKEFVNLGAQGILVWQFSPERNSALTCDGSSVFPDDPFCSITGNKTLTDTGTNTNNTGNTNIPTSINFNPQNPQKNTPFEVIIKSGTAFQYVYMKIFKSSDTEKKNPVFLPVTNRDDVPKTTAGNPNQWIYEVDKSLKEDGDYVVDFYERCDIGCKLVKSRPLSIGTGKTNEVQTSPKTPKTNSQNQTQTQQPQQQAPEQQRTQSASPNDQFCKGVDTHAGKKKYNLVFLPAGYPSLNDFSGDAQKAVDSLKKTNLGPNLLNKINIWAYADTSIDLQAGLCTRRGISTICVNQDAARSYAEACGGESYVILLNNDQVEMGLSYGMCSGEVALTTKEVDGGIRPFPHELGHSIACLNDEYLVPGGVSDLRINCSVDASNNENTPCPKWEGMWDVGCHPGCSNENWFRSTPVSIMNSTNFSWQFNSPSLQGWENKLQNYE